MIENIWLIIGAITTLSVLGFGIYHFLKLSKEKRIEMIKEWLLLAVIEAEKYLGGGTGEIKLRLVYDMFMDKFKFVAWIISFEQFKLMVDESLDIMRDMLITNQQLKEYIQE